MKKILLLLTVILLTGCQYFEGGKQKTKFSSFSKNTIEFRKNTIMLTKGYEKTSPGQFKTRLDSLKDSPKFKKIALEELKKIEDKNVDFQLFVDEKNVENYVFIYACDYFQLDEHRAATVVEALSRQLKDEALSQEVRYKRIHGRFFFTPTSKIVKLKYLKGYKLEKKYQAEYIVASRSGGIGLLISNLENVDFENSIKRLASK
ncbi:hypothetical protein SAMN04487910_0992 [Aquimarina amphilecti]|uniref:Lipoprotein n=1 Tax=Aquimarina amphilecti TaxID=1038014 RepID=A0A1H7JHC3_AQUAM|nr:hypothetical protein [Aquimarina amphilecti]SEK74009.1 hypothetical protein SAMN04487910_0992 [Aquimarina amphilecti]